MTPQTGAAIKKSACPILFITILLIIIFTIQSSHQQYQHQQQYQQQQQESVASTNNPALDINNLNIKILIPDLPNHHYQYWLKNHPRAFKVYNEIICPQLPQILQSNDLKTFLNYQSNLTFEDRQYYEDLPYGKATLNSICMNINKVPKSCWGYENNCQEIHLMPDCSGARDEEKQKILWFSQADFGYVLDRRKELSKFCSPNKNINDSLVSSFECTRYFQTCRGVNLFIQFNISDYNQHDRLPLPNDLIKKDNIGGWNCDLQLKRIAEENGQRERLQSWFNEFEHYHLVHNPPQQICELNVNRQAFIMKLDTSDDLYSALSNFVNLYATIHMNNRFSDDNQIIVWDRHLPSDTNGKFEHLWPAFSRFRPMALDQLNGKRVCFERFISVLPPKMMDGLMNYNTELAPGCSKSGLFDAFSKHVLHRLKIPQIYSPQYHFHSQNNLIRVILLSRSDNRRITNEDKLLAALRAKSKNMYVQEINFKEIKFNQVLSFVTNSDIIIGMHGSDLASSLFLPDWAVVVELYDCNDRRYYDLARLKGITYMRIDNSTSLINKVATVDGNYIKDDKLADYEVKVEEFMSVFARAEERLKKNRERHFKPFEHVYTVRPPPPQPPPTTSTPTTTTTTSTTTPTPDDQSQKRSLVLPKDTTTVSPPSPQAPTPTPPTTTTTTSTLHTEL